MKQCKLMKAKQRKGNRRGSASLFVVILLIGGTFFGGCGSKGTDPGEQLKAKRAELSELKEEIAELEKNIGDRDTTGGQGSGATLVKTRKVHPTTFTHSFQVSGTVEADEAVVVSPETQGKVEEILVEEGDKVSRGERIGTLNTAGIEQRIEEVSTRLSHARTVFERKKRLWKEKEIGSEIDYLNAKSQKESLEAKLAGLRDQLEMARLTAPIRGVVDDVPVKEGQLSAPGQPFAEIVNLDRISVEADVPEKYLPRVKEGESVTLRFPALGIEKKPSIRHVGNVIDPRNRTAKIHLNIGNDPDWTIKPNALARVRIRDKTVDSAYVVPSVILQNDLKGSFLYRVESTPSGLIARKTYVEPGMSQGDKTRIVSGLEKGDRIVVQGYDGLVDQAPIRLK